MVTIFDYGAPRCHVSRRRGQAEGQITGSYGNCKNHVGHTHPPRLIAE
jgi:hypothetical protein